MTTITINSDFHKDFKTNFENPKELYIYSREKLSPVSIYLVDENIVTKSIINSIENTANNKDVKLT